MYLPDRENASELKKSALELILRVLVVLVNPLQ